MTGMEEEAPLSWGGEVQTALDRTASLAAMALGARAAWIVLASQTGPAPAAVAGRMPAATSRTQLLSAPVLLPSGAHAATLFAAKSRQPWSAREAKLARGIADSLGRELGLLMGLRQTSRRAGELEVALEAVDQGIVMIDAAGSIAVMNARAGRLLDQPLDMRAPATAAPAAAGREPVQVLEARNADGMVLEVRSHVLPDGTTVQTYMDVTASRRAEEATSRSEARYRLLAENTSDLVALTDEAGLASYLSPAAQPLLGRAPETLVGAAFAQAVHPDDRQAVANARNRALSSDDPVRIEYRLQHADGSWVWVEAQLRKALADDGSDRPFLVSAIRDVSDRRVAMAAIRAAGEARSEFLATMSHEIRSPLSAIIGFTELLRAEPGLSPGQRDHLARVESASASLLAIVNDILDFSALDAGSVQLAAERFGPRDWLARTVSLVEPQAAAKGLTLDVIVDPAVSQWVVGDDRRLGQVLLNLLNNAVKFTRSGSVSVALSPDPGLPDGVRCSVRDTGIGIPADRLDRIFERFTQADGSITREFGGTGLGLAITQRLVTLMGGSIEVESVESEGSEFRFSVPLPAATGAEPSTTAMEQDVTQAVSMRVLVVDDLEMNRVLAGAMLRAAGHQVAEAEGGPQALALMRERPFDVVLMDVQMPGMDGVEATRAIRALPKPICSTPVVAMTAAVLSEQVDALRAAGLDDHLGKPFRRPDILAAVARWSPRPQAEPATEMNEQVLFEQMPPAGLDRTVLRELGTLVGDAALHLMLTQFSERLDDIEALWAEHGSGGSEKNCGGNWSARSPLASLVHQMISSSGMLGFASLSRALRELEQALRADHGVPEAVAAVMALAREARQIVTSGMADLSRAA